MCLKEIQIKIQIQIQPVLQAIEDASALHAKHKLLLDSYFLEKGSKPFIGETDDLSDGADNKYKYPKRIQKIQIEKYKRRVPSLS